MGFCVVIIFEILVCFLFFQMCVFFSPEVSQRKYADIGEICLKKLGARVAHLYFNIF